MKYFYTFLFLLFTFLLTSCSEQEKPELIMVTNATFPPYEYVQNGRIDGIDPCIIKRIADRLGYQLKIQDMSFDSVIAAVQSGKAHVAASGITVTEERKKQVAFSIPYVIAKQVIIVPENSPIASPEDLKK